MLLGGCPVCDSMTFSNFIDGGGGSPLCDAFRLRLPDSGNGSSFCTMRFLHFFLGGGGGGGAGLATFCGGVPDLLAISLAIFMKSKGGGPLLERARSTLSEVRAGRGLLFPTGLPPHFFFGGGGGGGDGFAMFCGGNPSQDS